MATWAAPAVAAVLAGSLIYCLLVILAALRHKSGTEHSITDSAGADSAGLPAISVLKPLSGADEGLERNLRGFFEQDYPEFEILFAVRAAGDAAVPIVEKLRAEYPGVESRLIVTGEPPYPNAKVFSLSRMLAGARHALLVMSDSDIRVTPGFLRRVAAEFASDGVDLATCPYRAVPGASLWSALEAIGMNTEFLAGVLVARLVEGMKFAVGPTTVARRRVIEGIGGFERLKDYLAEDFVMGRLAAEAGFGVTLSRVVVEHRIGSQAFRANMAHRLRWARSTRRSRPAGYLGQLFTYPLPLALILLALAPDWWPLALAAAAVRAAAAWATAGWILGDPLTARRWWLVPVQDLLSFAFWAAGFFGNTIVWRGRRYYLFPDGRFEPLNR